MKEQKNMSGSNKYLGLEFTDKIDLGSHLLGDLTRLCMSDDYADVEFLVEEQRIPAHRVVLAARSEYFRAMLYGKMLESRQSHISLDLSLDNFKVILEYIYTGTLSLGSLKGKAIIDLLGIANQYGFQDLEFSISNYLIQHLALNNVCLIVDAARLHQLKDLDLACHTFLDHNASDLLKHESFQLISRESLEEVLCRDSFVAPETLIFEAVLKWSQCNKSEDIKSLMALVRLPLLELDFLLDVVRPSGMVEPNRILDAIDMRRTSKLPYRSHLLSEENVASYKYSSLCTQGENCSVLLDGNVTTYDASLGYTWYDMSKKDDSCIMVKLGKIYMINHIRMLLWDLDTRAYSYYVEIASDQLNWHRVVDYRDYYCRSWQYLYFKAAPVRYIRIVGKRNTPNIDFRVVGLEAMYTADVPQLIDQIVVPKSNVITAEMNATISNVGDSTPRIFNNSSGNLGFVQHSLGTGGTIIRLRQPYHVGSMRFLLLNGSSSFYIETSRNGIDWQMAVDKRNDNCVSWQNLTFTPHPVVYIRVVGTRSFLNNLFGCMHCECPHSEKNVEE